MSFAERYVECAEAVTKAIQFHADSRERNGSAAYKALLDPTEFHDRVFTLTCVSMGMTVTRSGDGDWEPR